MRVLNRLRDQDLVAFNDLADDIETHPIIRQHFAARLRERFPDAWREGHNRLYEHLTQSTEPYPETLDSMMPLLRAVAHGCQAGRWREAAEDVFWSRIQRQREDFSTVKLGGSGPLLSALASFFAVPWSRTLPFPPAKQAYTLSQAAGSLSRLGRFPEALEAAVSAFQIDRMIATTLPSFGRSGARYLLAAGQDANTVAEFFLIVGPLSQAGGEAQEAFRIVYQTTDRFWWVVTLTTLAEVYHLMNHVEKAQERLTLAENIHRELEGRSLPFLYARQGFRYCAFLDDQGRYDDVLARASETVRAAEQSAHGHRTRSVVARSCAPCARDLSAARLAEPGG